MAETNKPEGYTFGRPTEYRSEYVEKTDNYVDSKDIPFIEELALDVLNCDEDTITNWANANKDFFGAIKRLKMKQKLALQKASLGKKFNVSGAIFQLKANHGMIETSRVESENTNANINVDTNKPITDESKSIIDNYLTRQGIKEVPSE